MPLIDNLLLILNSPKLSETLTFVLSNVNTLECSPVTTVQGGARLRLLTHDNPIDGWDLGFVLFTPNVPRPFHSAFHPDDKDMDKFSDDWFDKLVYVSYENYLKFKPAYDVLSTAGVFMRATMDHADACGCSCSCPCVPLKQLVVTAKDDKVTFHYEDHGHVYVLAANFVPDGDARQTAPMTAADFFIAATADKELIFKHPQHDTSMAKSEKSRPADCDKRRKRVTETVARLRNAGIQTVFSHPPTHE